MEKQVNGIQRKIPSLEKCKGSGEGSIGKLEKIEKGELWIAIGRRETEDGYMERGVEWLNRRIGDCENSRMVE